MSLDYSSPYLGSTEVDIASPDNKTVHYIKTSLQFNHYFPVSQNKDVIFAYSLRGGYLKNMGKKGLSAVLKAAFITKDNKPWVSFGLMGGAVQPQGHTQIVVNVIDFGMNLQEAGDAPRILHSGSSQPTDEIMEDGGYVSLESGFSTKARRKLVQMGHVLRDVSGSYGGYQAIMRDPKTGVYFGASESRKDGHAAGY